MGIVYSVKHLTDALLPCDVLAQGSRSGRLDIEALLAGERHEVDMVDRRHASRAITAIRGNGRGIGAGPFDPRVETAVGRTDHDDTGNGTRQQLDRHPPEIPVVCGRNHEEQLVFIDGRV